MNFAQRGLLILAWLSLSPAWGQTETWQDSQPCPSWVAQADGQPPVADKRWDITLSPYTHHWGGETAEHKPVVLGALDRAVAGNRFCGLSLFSNSFGQPTVYVYAGQRWEPLMANSQWFVKVTAGIFYGYVGKYKDKVPFNYNGFSPGIIPALGYAFSPTDSAQILVLGNAGVMFAYGHRF